MGPLERLPQAVAEQVVRRIVELLDIDEIVRRVDVDDIVQRVDVNAVLDRVDVDRLVERVDVDRLVERVDVNAIADRIDVDEIVQRADLGPIIAQSTTGMLGEFLGLLRREVVALDNILDAVTLFKRRTKDAPKGPPGLRTAAADSSEALTREGHYAGGITRLIAILVDIGALWGIFLLLTAGIEQAVKLLTGHSYLLANHRVLELVALVVWGFVYFTSQWALSGRTIGMAILGARVVTAEGGPVAGGAAAIRTLVLPFAIALWFIGLIEIVVRADRRALQDLAAGTCVVYDWQARSASLPWLHPAEPKPA